MMEVLRGGNISLAQVNEVLDYIVKIADDDESAHSIEDQLREAVLRKIASGAHDAGHLAALVLTSSQIKFSRWCA